MHLGSPDVPIPDPEIAIPKARASRFENHCAGAEIDPFVTNALPIPNRIPCVAQIAPILDKQNDAATLAITWMVTPIKTPVRAPNLSVKRPTNGPRRKEVPDWREEVSEAWEEEIWPANVMLRSGDEGRGVDGAYGGASKVVRMGAEKSSGSGIKASEQRMVEISRKRRFEVVPGRPRSRRRREGKTRESVTVPTTLFAPKSP
jgi:hypothetical protein